MGVSEHLEILQSKSPPCPRKGQGGGGVGGLIDKCIISKLSFASKQLHNSLYNLFYSFLLYNFDIVFNFLFLVLFSVLQFNPLYFYMYYTPLKETNGSFCLN